VLSRCLQFNLKRLTVDQIRNQMEHILSQEGIEFEPEAVRSVARAADGSMRDGLSLLDQAIIHGGGKLTDSEVNAMLGTVARSPVFGLIETLMAGDAPGLLRHIEELDEHSANFADALQQLLIVLHHISLSQWVPEVARRDDNAQQILALAQTASAAELQLFYQIGLMGQKDLALAPDPRMGFEMVMLRMLAFRPEVIPDVQGDIPKTPASHQKSRRASPTSLEKTTRRTHPPPGLRRNAPLRQ